MRKIEVIMAVAVEKDTETGWCRWSVGLDQWGWRWNGLYVVTERGTPDEGWEPLSQTCPMTLSESVAYTKGRGRRIRHADEE